MSRSYKHRGFIQDQSSKRFGKRLANKYVRRILEVPSGKVYRKYFESWNIADYILQSRGVLELISHRPGRIFKKVRKGGHLNPWLNINNECTNELWRDWNK